MTMHMLAQSRHSICAKETGIDSSHKQKDININTDTHINMWNMCTP